LTQAEMPFYRNPTAFQVMSTGSLKTKGKQETISELELEATTRLILLRLSRYIGHLL